MELKKAKEKKFSKIITFTGNDENNKLSKLGDINFWVNSKAYNLIENTHQILLLSLVDLIIGKKRIPTKLNSLKEENLFLKNYKNLKVLITGTTGFKGSWLAFWLQELGAKVVGIGLRPEKNFILYESLNLKKELINTFLIFVISIN